LSSGTNAVVIGHHKDVSKIQVVPIDGSSVNNSIKYLTKRSTSAEEMYRRMMSTIVATNPGTLYRSKQRTLKTFRQSVVKSSSLPSAVKIKPWPTPVVEASGDYRNETWLETFVGGPLYAKQSTLPALPVPKIEETLERLIPTALPLAKSQSEREEFLDCVKKFPQQAQLLQQRLEQRRDSLSVPSSSLPPTSWLQEWWNKMGYLQVRDPLLINVSYFFHFRNDSTADQAHNPQIARGAALLYATAKFRNLVASGQLPAETVGRGDRAKPLCSTAMKYLFHATRIPVVMNQDSDPGDIVKLYDPATHHHAVVARHGMFYTLPLVDPTSSLPYAVSSLEAALHQIIDHADSMAQNADGNKPPPLGWLTSMNRNDWGKARESLLAAHPSMAKALQLLESGAILLCLDSYEPHSRADAAGQWVHGGSQCGSNRWFDKSAQVIVTPSGTAAFVGEHSMMDGMPVVRYADQLARTVYRDVKSVPHDGSHLTIEPIFDPSWGVQDDPQVTQHISKGIV
jgi:carnitine O-acetyltransferase